jgi:hypothetical protein
MTWQPIATAPKDGTRIIGSDGDRVDIYQWEAQSYHKRPSPYWERSFHPVYYDRQQQPTHWMPLPEPPQVAS